MTAATLERRVAVWGAEQLTVKYGARTALDDVSIDVRPGGVTVVVGGDGAGKTTLLRAVAGAVRPQSGRVRRPARAHIGYIAGASGLYADLTVDENVAFVGAAYELGHAERDRRAAELMRQTGIEGTGGRLAGRLSGGMRQKLALALAMLHEPKLLILDEPTTGVDPVSRSEVWRLIAQAAADGAAVLVATTYLDEAERAAEVLVLDDGRAVAAGPPEAVAAALPRPEAPRGGRAARAAQDDGVATRYVGQGGERAMAPLAVARAVTRRFGSFVAVDGAYLDVQPGEVVGLLGANGAGKTTVIRMLLGLLPPSEGRALLFGAPPSRASRRRIGYVPQGLGLWDDLSVGENLAFAAAAFGSYPPPLDAELEASRDVLVRDLPLGLKRRLAFASALAHAPELLVLDEPTSGVDPRARARLWDTVHEAAAGGAGVLVTTHYLEETAQCDRLVIMAAGRVVAQGRETDIVGDRTAVAVELVPAETPADAASAGAGWAVAFGALADAGLSASLHGRTLRVAGGDEARVRAALDARRVAARLDTVPATLEETFVELARTAAHTTDPEKDPR
jgi:ABC-2 type transport system ATP-binding protein